MTSTNSEDWSPKAKAMEQALIALGDQVQKEVDNSGLPVFGFVLIAQSGNVEYRTRWVMEDFKVILMTVAQDLKEM